MNYQKQYANKINWQNKPSTSTPLNATNLNKMDTALWYMDNALYMLANAVGGGSSIRGGIISSIASNIITTHVTMRTGESLATDELLLLRSNAEGAGNNISIYTDEYSAEDYGLVDLDGEETSVTLTDTSILLLMLDTDEYTATVLGVMDENSGLAGLGIGKMTNYSSGVITTDIDLHRDPVIGDRILLYCSSDISVSNDSIKTYNDGVAVTTDIGPILPQTIVKGFNVLQCVAAIPSGIVWSVKLNVPIVAYSAGTGIMIDNNGVISNANPNYGENYDYKKIDSAIDDGNLGDFNGYCDNLIIDFHANAVSGGDAYTLTLVTGTSTIIRKYAVLKDRSGNPFTRDINAGMILKCESNVSGSGTELDPIVVTVLEIGNWYVESGRKANTTIGAKSTAEGEYNTVSGAYGHADGYGNTASGNSASAHGIASTASGDCSVADGSYTTASGANSSAHGDSTIASGIDSSASGEGTIAGYLHQTAMGRFNENKSGNLLEVGNGSDDDNRSNALEVTADGHVLDGNGNDLQSVAALEASASGNPIVVNAQGIDAKELSVELEPIQDLHGYDKPWVGGAGKNMIPMTVDSIKSRNTMGTWNGNEYSLFGLKFKLVTDSADNIIGIDVDGLSTNRADLLLGSVPFSVGTYKISGSTGGSLSTWVIWCNTHGTAEREMSIDGEGEFYQANAATLDITLSVFGGTTVNHKMFYPMVRVSTASNTFEPWSNICPISGRTEVGVLDTGKNLLPMTVANLKSLNTGGTWDGDVYTYGNATLEILTQNGEITGFKANGTFAYNLVFKLGAPANGDLLSGCPSGGSWNSYVVYQDNSGPVDSGSGASGVLANENISIYIKQGYSANNLIFKPMVRMTGTSADYEPPKTSSVTIQLGQTVYGTRINFKTGEGIVDKAIATFTGASGENWRYSSGDNTAWFYADVSGSKTARSVAITNAFDKNYERAWNADNNAWIRYSQIHVRPSAAIAPSGNTEQGLNEFKTWLASNNLQVCYELATPTELTLTPSMLKLLEGYNYITADGEMQLVYIPESVLPTPPTTDGNYKLRCTVTNGVPSFSWVSDV